MGPANVLSEDAKEFTSSQLSDHQKWPHMVMDNLWYYEKPYHLNADRQ
jgi:hypothetical protein